MTFHTLLQVMWYASQVPQVVIQHSLSSSGVYDSCFYLAMGGIVTRLLLLLAGDVEENPGPVDTGELTRGLATLITEASAGVKPVLGVWAPDKENMVAE